MTGDTANTFVQVNTVIEVGKIREIIHSGPGNGLPRPETVPHGGKEGTCSPDIGMTIHTRFSVRHSSNGADFHRAVAVAPVNTKPTHAMLMADQHRTLVL